ncbi:intracellular protein transport protein [Cucurbitaria berberidis CBS 394.84]|uniref:Intracellular protein transport protein n=1 Tax=Cucurbitaria berberidis CBS 394.84 TaxID=1168544 RepID=A0A9P4GGR7_9PLEO|nr:intracellular protein transport protein [Cucurbitaria berberidis CBS 394.84]KAF1845265.1 intracellular protein transport protein [Cucurbitaria berberidis CBS 394.84]
MMRVLEANAPPKQTATDTISTLSSRLTSATLLEDRRAAILGLRSFAKEYPASVASGALRHLIASLVKDAEDVDTLKVVLETLLMLFHPDEASPEASDEIALWLADQFSQRQDNITILIDLLDKPDFYSRLYALQLIRAIALARPERTQECILAAPMGTTYLVATLDDPRDAVRNEGLVVLTDLSRSSTELQKLFVFEDAFTKVFSMIRADGGLTQGGVVVQDCLSLLATLIRYNTSNQTNIREMGHVAQFAALLPGGKKPKKQRAGAEEEDDWLSPQSDKNIWGLLAIMRMFLVTGSVGTLQNQNVFQQHGLLRQLLNIAFDPVTTMPIKIEALNTCADLIRGNARLQEGFAQEQVRPVVEPATNSVTSPKSAVQVYVIEALLNLVLAPASNELFDMRNAGCECIKAYFHGHTQIQEHFLNRAIGGHEGGDETANALTILLAGPQASPATDPYRLWFAATLVYHLIFNDIQAKSMLMQVKEGDAERGEEVVTCIQTLTANLIASLQLGEDARIAVAYLMLLLGWLFDDATAVDDFLGEASSLQSLVQAVLTPGSDRVVIRGLCAALLGVVYEFSTKDSPVPRRELQPVLVAKIGREKYLDAIVELRHHPLVRDFEVLPRIGGAGGSLPEVFFDEAFIDFLKDNFSRLSRAIDRNPNIEQHQSHDGIDRDVVDALRGERDEKEQTIQELKAQLMTLEQKIDQEQAEHRKTQQSADEQRNTLKRINDKLHDDLDKEIASRDREYRQATLELENKYNLQIVALNNKVQQTSKDGNLAISKVRQEYDERLRDSNQARVELERRLGASDKARQEALETIRSLEQTQQRTRLEIATITETLHSLQSNVQKSEAQVKKLTNEKTSLQSNIDNLKLESQELKTKAQDQTWKVKDAEEKLRKAQISVGSKDNDIKELQDKVRKAEESENEKQAELDDLFVLLSDLEEKRSKDKKRLKALGEEVSDAEDDDDDDDDDENSEGDQSGDDDEDKE